MLPNEPFHTAKAGATKGIVYVPDIFGVTSQAHQVRNESMLAEQRVPIPLVRRQSIINAQPQIHNPRTLQSQFT